MNADVQAHWLPFDSYLDAIERESRRFRECLADADPDLRVPSCPDWSAEDLLWHLGGDVQHFWAWVIAQRPEGPESYPEPHRPGGHAGVLAFYDQAHEDLLLRLCNADPADGAWSWSADPRLHTVGFTMRRQAHEALVHRVDAELTVGARTPLDPVLAADGVLECLDVMYGSHPRWGRFTPDGTRVVVELTDVGRRLLVGLGRFAGRDPRSGEVVDVDDLAVLDPALHEHTGAADVTVRGSAEQVDLWLWHRGIEDALAVDGDEGVHERLVAILGAPIG
ncbi:maleylpyruvate isomerase N-terminal domain-containing protein [Janibacter terrae]|uniref:maleylpyruvate isomerase N-terminal domain-containing protein n=1 Tax=Janibacter terrae TaxID=103817 RepID=UPI0008386E7C|nr:maleylpyruvate isomerase N-terminal domain-containing protein [Janibacter terrae]